VEFAGYRAGVRCATGSVRAAEILVAVLAASNYTFPRFSEAWIGAHVEARSFLGGVLKALVAGQRLQRPKVRLFSGSVVPQMPRGAPYGDPLSCGLMETMPQSL
jgi:transposase